MINDALKSSGFNDPIQFTADRQSLYAPKKKKRRRRITWFNPPFSESVATNIGRCFLELVKKHFPKGSVLHKICNRNILKISYSSMPNVGNIIKKHNARVRKSEEARNETSRLCNCRDPEQCPLRGECLTE